MGTIALITGCIGCCFSLLAMTREKEKWVFLGFIFSFCCNFFDNYCKDVFVEDKIVDDRAIYSEKQESVQDAKYYWKDLTA